MNDDSIKQKNDLMHSMMANPKMARTFKEAMAAPIGSTKREHAKSILSIMKKVGGMKNDGQGGFLSDLGSSISSGFNSLFGGGQPSTTTAQSTPSTTLPNYSNMTIFPAAPKFKESTPAPNMSTVNGPVYAPPPTSLPKMSKFETPVKTPAKMSVLPPAPAHVQHASPFVEMTGNLLGPVGAGVASVAPGIAGGAQYLAQNTAQALTDAWYNIGSFFSPYTVDPVTGKTDPRDPHGPGYTSFGDTWGGKIASDQFVPFATPSSGGNFPGSTTANIVKGTTPPQSVTDLFNFMSNGSKSGTSTGGSSTGSSASFNQGGATGSFGTATANITPILSKALGATIDPAMSLGDFIRKYGAISLVNAMPINEGGSPAGVVNNPGNIKFNNLPGQTDSGVQATDGGTFASYSTPEAGKQAIADLITNAASGASASYGTNPTVGSFIDTYTNTAPGSSSGGSSGIANQAQNAVNQGTGPGSFALGVANKTFGGSLDEYISNLDAKLKKDFNLGPLEQQLSDLKSESTAFIPTLTSYIQGKDQYSKAIDSMISQAEGRLLTTNMADPFTANQYKNYMNYLYTLRGRQNGRYANYLNAAVSDYNADVTKTQSQYETVYKNYNDALTRGSTIAQNEYNTLYTSMADLYTNLEQAPTKAINAQILQEQLYAAHVANLQNGTNGAVTTNPKFWTDVTTLTKQLTDSNATGEAQGALDITALPAGGLAGFFAANSYAGSDPQAAAYAINMVMAKSLQNTADIAEVSKMKKLVSDLAATPGGDQLAAMISPSLAKASYQILADYVTSNLKDLKSAANDLAKGGGKDKVAWMNKHKNLDTGILEDLYNYMNLNLGPGTSDGTSPSGFVDKFFGGTSGNVASSLMTGW